MVDASSWPQSRCMLEVAADPCREPLIERRTETCLSVLAEGVAIDDRQPDVVERANRARLLARTRQGAWNERDLPQRIAPLRKRVERRQLRRDQDRVTL